MVWALLALLGVVLIMVVDDIVRWAEETVGPWIQENLFGGGDDGGSEESIIHVPRPPPN